MLTHKLKYLMLLLSITLLMPFQVTAHPGHDHHSIWASLAHWGWLAPLLFAIAALSHALHRHQANKGDQK